MTTPTPSKQVLPHQEMTPGSFANHLAAFSPLPSALRSVAPSPAYLPKRSPANAATLQHHHTGSSHSIPPLSFDSPGATALALSLNLPAFSGTSDGHVRGDEDERRRRMENIVNLLRTRPGRVSEEGVERLAKRTGLEYIWEGPPGGPRMLSIAGTGVLIDDNAVTNVAISFLKSPEAPTVPAPRAAEILLRTLRPSPGESPIDTTLTPFAAHLERLARLDKLSSPGLNCFEAIAGIYASLRRLFEYETRKVKQSREAQGNISMVMDQDTIEKEILCRHSGRPDMHVRGRVGLSVEYWTKSRLIPSDDPDSDAGASGAPTKSGDPAPPSVHRGESDTWAVVIECQSLPATLYPPVRLSDQWLSDTIEMNANEQVPFGPWDGSTLDWQEPLALTLSDPATDAMVIDSGLTALGRPADVRFVARLEPHLVVPLSVAYEIYATVGIQIPQESLQPTTFDGLLIPTKDPSIGADGQGREIKRRRRLTVPRKEGGMGESVQDFTLWVQKPEYGRVIEEIPFSHPRQLISIFPILRQYACLYNVIQTTLGSQALDAVPGTTPNLAQRASVTRMDDPDDDIIYETNDAPEDAELDYLLSDVASKAQRHNSERGLPIDTALSTQPSLRLTTVIPWHEESGTTVFEIHRGGDISTTGETLSRKQAALVGTGPGTEEIRQQIESDMQKTAKALSRALEISEDMGIVMEWARARLS